MQPDTARLVVEAVLVTVAMVGIGFASLWAYMQARRHAPGAVQELVQLTTELSNRLTTLERDRDRDYLERQAERQRDYAIIAKLQRRVADLEHGVERLGAQVVRLGGVPEWELPPAEPLPVVQTVIDDTALYRSIAALFDVDELDDLAFRLGIEPDELDGKRRDTRARSLVQYCKRRDLLPELIDIARQLRPEGRF
jgi:hypothetical protein